MSALASWDDLRAATPPKDPLDDGRCHAPAWVYNRQGKYLGEVDCLRDRGHAADYHASMLYRWPFEARRFYSPYAPRGGSQHDPRRRA